MLQRVWARWRTYPFIVQWILCFLPSLSLVLLGGAWVPNRSYCVPGYVSRSDKTPPVWRCPVHGWNIRLDDMSLPWWRRSGSKAPDSRCHRFGEGKECDFFICWRCSWSYMTSECNWAGNPRGGMNETKISEFLRGCSCRYTAPFVQTVESQVAVDRKDAHWCQFYLRQLVWASHGFEASFCVGDRSNHCK